MSAASASSTSNCHSRPSGHSRALFGLGCEPRSGPSSLLSSSLTAAAAAPGANPDGGVSETGSAVALSSADTRTLPGVATSPERWCHHSSGNAARFVIPCHFLAAGRGTLVLEGPGRVSAVAAVASAAFWSFSLSSLRSVGGFALDFGLRRLSGTSNSSCRLPARRTQSCVQPRDAATLPPRSLYQISCATGLSVIPSPVPSSIVWGGPE
mmetsp:Transcript_17592/g.53859  ORF Transcript_17592/g.53859 Transcript_17592/m.53859 type:complete len:210 (+) Transcript_17592:345-974(+)